MNRRFDIRQIRGHLPIPRLAAPSIALLTALSAAPSLTCSAPTPADSQEEVLELNDPALDGKSDQQTDNAADMGVIQFGESKAGKFSKRYVSYHFQGPRKASVTITANGGPTAATDTVLWLYGPKNEAGWGDGQPLAKNDDALGSYSSKLSEVTLPETGEYLIVVAVKNRNLGSKTYALQLDCVSGCEGGTPEPEVSDALCTDGADNDGNGYKDCDDWSCCKNGVPAEDITVCKVGSCASVNGGGGSGAGGSGGAGESTDATCGDGIDNDGDGYTDCSDYSCCKNGVPGAGVTVCLSGSCKPSGGAGGAGGSGSSESTNATCGDGIDNDGDGYTDCSDYSCCKNGVPGAGITVCVSGTCKAAGQGGSGGGYGDLDGLSDSALVAALHSRIAGHTAVSYDAARKLLFGSSGIDVHNGKVECAYSGKLFNYYQMSQSGGFNCEHSWPQSEFGAESTSAKSDMHHLFATEMTINGCRSSNPYGEIVGTPKPNCSSGGSALGTDATGGFVFTVRPQYRGDIARAHFYFSVRYSMAIDASEETVLREWHHQDMPDSVETTRNESIAAVQKNRNPFVDWPEMVDRISDF